MDKEQQQSIVFLVSTEDYELGCQQQSVVFKSPVEDYELGLKVHSQTS
jgi:hypothetical protein